MANRQTPSIEVISNDITYIRDDVKEIKDNLRSSYVSKDEFDPVKKIVYGLVGLILVAVMVAVLGLVIIK